MNTEEQPRAVGTSVEKIDIAFDIDQRKEGVVLYAFTKGVGVVIDTTGKNYVGVPELFFGPYTHKTGVGSLDKPSIKDSNINMAYVALCIDEVVRVTGMHTFWFYPYDGDVPITGDAVKDEKAKELRRKARLKIFAEVLPDGAITQDENAHGYIVTI